MPKFEAAYHFPKGFLWGTATASHQVEGGNTNNNWYRWEQTPGKIREGHLSGLACDWWGGRWKEDFDRAVETGQNAHRMSIEWSRIQPEPDRWDEDALDYYREMIRGLVDRNLMPFITLHHFSNPLWLEDMGGWLNPETPRLFEVYVRKVVEALKEYVTLWVTINEPNVFTYAAYMNGDFPPGHTSMPETWNAMVEMARGHAAAYHAIHELQPESRVGLAINFRQFEPRNAWSPFDRFLAGMLDQAFNRSYIDGATDGKLRFLNYRANLPQLKGTQDFIGVNYYSRDFVSFKPFQPDKMFFRLGYDKADRLSGIGFIANVPQGFSKVLKSMTKYSMPILVSENGVEDEQDSMRPAYTLEHIHQMWRGVNFNWPIKGYFHWSLVDNFEWERGWTQRFGLWGLERETQKRIRRKSVDLFEEICRENGITTAMVEKYAPESMGTIFPA